MNIYSRINKRKFWFNIYIKSELNVNKHKIHKNHINFSTNQESSHALTKMTFFKNNLMKK